MQEVYTFNFGISEINFIADAIDTYRYTISRVLDVQSQDSVGQIVENIYNQFKNAVVNNGNDVVDDDNIIIDVEPEVIPNEESEAE